MPSDKLLHNKHRAPGASPILSTYQSSYPTKSQWGGAPIKCSLQARWTGLKIQMDWISMLVSNIMSCSVTHRKSPLSFCELTSYELCPWFWIEFERERETRSCLWHPGGMSLPALVKQTNRKRSGSFVPWFAGQDTLCFCTCTCAGDNMWMRAYVPRIIFWQCARAYVVHVHLCRQYAEKACVRTMCRSTSGEWPGAGHVQGADGCPSGYLPAPPLFWASVCVLSLRISDLGWCWLIFCIFDSLSGDMWSWVG